MAAMSYVTGAHNFKVGFENQRGHFWRGDNNDSTGGIWYTTTNSVPAFVIIQAPAYGWQNNLNYNLGIYAQDRWTVNRMTVSGGIRLDMLNESTSEFTLGPHRWLPNRNTHYDAVKNVPNWKDINPRVSVAYDLFGNGKTALKGEREPGRGAELDRDRRGEQPGNDGPNADAASVERRGTGLAAFRRLHSGLRPDHCTANGECGPWRLRRTSAAAIPTHPLRPRDHGRLGRSAVQLGVLGGVQHEIVPRLSVSAWLLPAHLRQLQRRRQRGAERDRLHAVLGARADDRTPGGTLGRGHDDWRPLRPEQHRRRTTSSRTRRVFGKQTIALERRRHRVDARLRNGLLLQGGVSTGKDMYDYCDIIDDVPEALTPSAAGDHHGASGAAGSVTPAGFCQPGDAVPDAVEGAGVVHAAV